MLAYMVQFAYDTSHNKTKAKNISFSICSSSWEGAPFGLAKSKGYVEDSKARPNQGIAKNS